MTKIITKPTSESLASVPKSAKSLQHLRIKHPRIKQIMDELEMLIYPGSQDSLLMVCGPTGVGKSTLAHHIVNQALESASGDMAEDAGLIPAIYVEARASGEAAFSWRLLDNNILSQLNPEPMNCLPRARFGIDAGSGRMIRPSTSPRSSLASIRTAIERDIAARGTKFIVIDEAAHIFRQTTPRNLETHLDTLKSLANSSGAQIILIGSYDLYQLMSLSGQLARRTHVLHFERYRQDRPEDERDFKVCVEQFQSQLPHLWGEKLTQHTQALHENTMGCIGTLSSVLTRTAVRLEQAQGWDVDILRRSLLTDAQCNRILEEILEGEAAINPGLARTLLKPKPRVANYGRRTA